MKIGLNVKLDVTKIDKAKLFKGAKGTYLDLTVFFDTEETSQYGDNGTVTQSTSKEDRGAKMPIIGNVKVFYKTENQPPNSDQYQAPEMGDDSEIPF